MRLSIFTKLFIVQIVFILIPVIITGALIVLSYERSIDNFFKEENRIIFAPIIQSLYLTLTEIKIQIILAIFVIIALSLIISILFTYKIIFSLKKIIKGTKKISEGNFDFFINIKSKDELGELATFFNEMIEKLKENKISLDKTKEVLEKEVIERTQELKELAETREELVRERTKELQDKIDELEIIHHLSVGRELKMIELKKEIDKLTNKNKNKKNKI